MCLPSKATYCISLSLLYLEILLEVFYPNTVVTLFWTSNTLKWHPSIEIFSFRNMNKSHGGAPKCIWTINFSSLALFDDHYERKIKCCGTGYHKWKTCHWNSNQRTWRWTRNVIKGPFLVCQCGGLGLIADQAMQDLGGQSGSTTGFSLSTSIISSQYHLTNGPCSYFIHLALMLCSFTSQHHY